MTILALFFINTTMNKMRVRLKHIINAVISVQFCIIIYLLTEMHYIPMESGDFEGPIPPLETKEDIHKKSNSSPLKVHNNLKKILLWTPFWTHDDYFFGLGWKPFVNAKCKENKCYLTKNRSFLSFSDAILVHANNIRGYYSLPHKRRDDSQVWIYFNLEPPTETRVNLGLLDGYFNMSISYREDSDLRVVYGEMVPLSETEKALKDNPNSRNFALRKTKLVAWFVSHCPVSSARDWFGHKLRKYITVDIYGLCGSLDCNTTCNNMLKRDYKFYLAFENSLCRDYMSEKVWRTMLLDVVPIVLGDGGYEKILPPHSYIDVKDFNSVQDLADYLLLLDKHDDLYNEYFQWRWTHKVIYPYTMSTLFCNLCWYLHAQSEKRKVIKDMNGWYGIDSSCKDPVRYFSHVNGFPKHDPYKWAIQTLSNDSGHLKHI